MERLRIAEIKRKIVPVSAGALFFWCIFRSVGFMTFVAFVAGAASMFCVFAVLLIVYLKNESKDNLNKPVTTSNEIHETSASPTKEVIEEPKVEVRNPYKSELPETSQLSTHTSGEVKNPYRLHSGE